MNKNKYSTQSISLAAALYATSKAQLIEIDFSYDPKRASFVFKHEDPNLDKVIDLFWSKQLPVDASTFFESLRYLKSRLYEAKNAQ